MRDEIKEVRRLRHLLKTQRLTPSERGALEQQISELERSQSPQSIPSTAGVFGMFDRPKPGTSDPQPVPVEAEKLPQTAKPSMQPVAEPELLDATPDLSPEEFEALAEKLTAIADRITRLRAYWATTLAVEVDRESEVCLARLHEKAKDVPEELLEIILGDRMYLLRKKVRDVSKPTITQKLQLRTIAPTAPSLDVVGTWTELYYAIHEPRSLRPPEHLPGYVPDGLQALVS